MPSNLSDEDLIFLQKDKDLLAKNPANPEDITLDTKDDIPNYIEPETELTEDDLPPAHEADITPRNI